MNTFKTLRKLSIFVHLGILFILQACGYSKQRVDNTFGEARTIKSKVLKENRKILIYIPEKDTTSYNINEIPVIYLLDGETYFTPVVEMLRLFNEENKSGTLPKMAVIGIINTNRDRDLTPSKDINPSASSSMPLNDEEYINTGGAMNFAKFINNELIPFISDNYGLTSKRILIGHSFGGLMATNTLLRLPTMFDGYIAVDPSIWWNHREMTKLAKNVLYTDTFINTAFFYANSDFAAELSKSLKKGDPKNPYQNQLEFGNAFMSNQHKLLYFSWVHYKRESHGTVPLIAIFDGLQSLNNYFTSVKSSPQSFLPRDELSKKSDTLYKELDHISIHSDIYKQECCPRIFSDSTHTSSNLFRLMGEFNILKGDTPRAVINFKNSLGLNPFDSAVQKRVATLTQIKQ